MCVSFILCQNIFLGSVWGETRVFPMVFKVDAHAIQGSLNEDSTLGCVPAYVCVQAWAYVSSQISFKIDWEA